jgi:hypothetical protein
MLGEREAMTTPMIEGAQAFREALKERTRERVPLDWAWTNQNLGLLLIRLPGSASNADSLFQAIECFTNAASAFLALNQPAAKSSLNKAQEAFEVMGKTYGEARKQEYLARIDERVRAYLK